MSNNMAGARFSVVIVNYNGGALLRKAVESALRERVPAQQVYVVDNGSVDGSDCSIEAVAAGIHVLRNGCNAGFARAVNQALRLAGSEFVLLLNNDASLESNALQEFAGAFDRMPSLAIAGGGLRYPDGRLQRAFGPLPTLLEEIVPPGVLKSWNPDRYRRSTSGMDARMVESVYGACLAVRASAVQTIGLLDEDFFFYFEEVDWCRRAQRAGFQVAFIPQAQADHISGHTAGKSFAAARIEYQRSKLTYFRKAESRTVLRFVYLAMLVRSATNALFQTLAVVLTLFSNARARRKAFAYWTVLVWQLRGCPKRWGLPGKCPAAQNTIGAAHQPTTDANGVGWR